MLYDLYEWSVSFMLITIWLESSRVAADSIVAAECSSSRMKVLG
jgi:hypothetical protein